MLCLSSDKYTLLERDGQTFAAGRNGGPWCFRAGTGVGRSANAVAVPTAGLPVNRRLAFAGIKIGIAGN